MDLTTFPGTQNSVFSCKDHLGQSNRVVLQRNKQVPG